MAQRLCAEGATDVELGVHFGVGGSTIRDWQRDHSEFSAAVASGKQIANAKVEHALFHRALGYTVEAEKLFPRKDGTVVRATFTQHVPPETAAAMFWLKNRDPERWGLQAAEREKPPVSFTFNLYHPNEDLNPQWLPRPEDVTEDDD